MDRLGGGALGVDPTYLLYLPSRSRGGLRRIDFGAWPRTAVLTRQIPPESTCKPLLHTRGISRARSFDLEVTPWAPTRLTSCIFHPGPEESSGASTLPPGPAQPPSASNFPPNRPHKPLLDRPRRRSIATSLYRVADVRAFRRRGLGWGGALTGCGRSSRCSVGALSGGTRREPLRLSLKRTQHDATRRVSPTPRDTVHSLQRYVTPFGQRRSQTDMV